MAQSKGKLLGYLTLEEYISRFPFYSIIEREFDPRGSGLMYVAGSSELDDLSQIEHIYISIEPELENDEMENAQVQLMGKLGDDIRDFIKKYQPIDKLTVIENGQFFTAIVGDTVSITVYESKATDALIITVISANDPE